MFLACSGAAVAGFITLLGITSWVRERRRLHPAICRKLVHLTMGLVCLVFPRFVSNDAQAIALALIFLATLVLLRRAPAPYDGMARIFSYRKNGIGGEFYFTIAVGLLLVCARDNYLAYTASILILGISDVAAAAVGHLYGRTRCWGNQKTLEGSTAFFVTAFTIAGILAISAGIPVELTFLVALCLIATITEAISRGASDNATVPLACLGWFIFGDEAASLVGVSSVLIGVTGLGIFIASAGAVRRIEPAVDEPR